MQQGNTIFDLKGQARRLRTALAEQHMDVTHAAALNLIARAQGARNWEALEAALTEKHETEQASLQAAQLSAAQSADQWLDWLEAALRMRDVFEDDLDDLVHDCLAPEEASRVNNDGLRSQVKALLTWHHEPHVRDPRRSLVEQLENVIDGLELPMPESTKGGERFGFAIGARVSVCAGSRFERELKLDCLEWFACHAPEDVSRLVVDGLHNSSLSDEVALWLSEHSLDSQVRAQLQDLLGYMRSVHSSDDRRLSDVVGLTVDIDEAGVAAFLDSQIAAGVEFSQDALDQLGLKQPR